MGIGAHAAKCACGSANCAEWEARLGPELRPLDSEDSQGNVFVSMRGSPDMRPERIAARDAAEGELTRRKRLLDLHPFKNDTDWCVYRLYAEGTEAVAIGRMFGVTRTAIRKRVARIEREHLQGAPMSMEHVRGLMEECDPGTVSMIFTLIGRAIEQPEEMRRWLDAAKESVDWLGEGKTRVPASVRPSASADAILREVLKEANR